MKKIIFLFFIFWNLKFEANFSNTINFHPFKFEIFVSFFNSYLIGHFFAFTAMFYVNKTPP